MSTYQTGRFYQDENVDPTTRAASGKPGLAKRGLSDVTNQAAGSSSFGGKKIASGRAPLRAIGAQQDASKALADLSLAAPVKDVDSADRNDPCAVVEYLPEIFSYCQATEANGMPNPDYMRAQTDINEKMRTILIDWLIDVHLKFKLMPETMYLTVNVIDRFLSAKHVARKKLQLVGVTSMLLASKYEEIYAPEVKDFVYISDKAYTRAEILTQESLMLNTLGFDMQTCSPLFFLTRFLKCADNAAVSDRQLALYAHYCVELTLQQYSMIKYLPSMVAASSLLIAQNVTGRGTWDTTLVAHTKYSEAALHTCARDMFGFVQTASRPGQLQAVKKKYSSIKFSEVAKLPIPSCI